LRSCAWSGLIDVSHAPRAATPCRRAQTRHHGPHEAQPMKPPNTHNGEEPAPEPWITKQAAPRRASKRHDPLDRAPATSRSAAHPHARPEPLPHLGGRGLAARAVQLVARPVDQTSSTPRAPPLPSFSPLFAAIRGPTANRGARIRTGDLTTPNRARYQAAPRPVRNAQSTATLTHPPPIRGNASGTQPRHLRTSRSPHRPASSR
jgi:hypothetical protein